MAACCNSATSAAAIPTAWFCVTAPFEQGSKATEFEVEIRPNIDPQWRRPPVHRRFAGGLPSPAAQARRVGDRPALPGYRPESEPLPAERHRREATRQIRRAEAVGPFLYLSVLHFRFHRSDGARGVCPGVRGADGRAFPHRPEGVRSRRGSRRWRSSCPFRCATWPCARAIASGTAPAIWTTRCRRRQAGGTSMATSRASAKRGSPITSTFPG